MFHYYTAADRIDLSGLCDDRKHQCLPSPDSMALSFLPSVDDDAALRDNISVLIARILIKHMPFMKMSFGDITPSTSNILSVKKYQKDLKWLVFLVQMSNFNLKS